MDKKDLQPERIFRVVKLRLLNGIHLLQSNRIMRTITIIYWLLFAAIMMFYQPAGKIGQVAWFLLRLPFSAAVILVFFASLVKLATPKDAIAIEHDLLRAGIVNSIGEWPILLSIRQVEGNRQIAELYSCGISISKYNDLLLQMEAALNRRIVRIEEGKDKQTILLYLAPGDVKLPEKIDWSDTYMNEDDFTIALGTSLDGTYEVNLNVTPHMIVAGSTGSGKTILIKAIMYQALKKKADVYLIDMKGGLDYPKKWRTEVCNYADERNDALSLFSAVDEQLERRKIMLEHHECANIAEFNRKYESKLPHIVMVIDEIAELTVSTGLSKEQKQIVENTNRLLDKIARLGRAYGIHLIIGTQRPDANILPGQTKANCDVRICGRADNTLSMIILDNTDAADRIPKDSRGRFLTNSGLEFQGYWIDI